MKKKIVKQSKKGNWLKLIWPRIFVNRFVFNWNKFLSFLIMVSMLVNSSVISISYAESLPYERATLSKMYVQGLGGIKEVIDARTNEKIIYVADKPWQVVRKSEQGDIVIKKWEYDRYGNLKSVYLPGTYTREIYNENGKIVREEMQIGLDTWQTQYSYVYDNMGNLSKKNTHGVVKVNGVERVEIISSVIFRNGVQSEVRQYWGNDDRGEWICYGNEGYVKAVFITHGNNVVGRLDINTIDGVQYVQSFAMYSNGEEMCTYQFKFPESIRGVERRYFTVNNKGELLVNGIKVAIPSEQVTNSDWDNSNYVNNFYKEDFLTISGVKIGLALASQNIYEGAKLKYTVYYGTDFKDGNGIENTSFGKVISKVFYDSHRREIMNQVYGYNVANGGSVESKTYVQYTVDCLLTWNNEKSYSLRKSIVFSAQDTADNNIKNIVLKIGNEELVIGTYNSSNDSIVFTADSNDIKTKIKNLLPTLLNDFKNEYQRSSEKYSYWSRLESDLLSAVDAVFNNKTLQDILGNNNSGGINKILARFKENLMLNIKEKFNDKNIVRRDGLLWHYLIVKKAGDNIQYYYQDNPNSKDYTYSFDIDLLDLRNRVSLNVEKNAQQEYIFVFTGNSGTEARINIGTKPQDQDLQAFIQQKFNEKKTYIEQTIGVQGLTYNYLTTNDFNVNIVARDSNNNTVDLPFQVIYKEDNNGNISAFLKYVTNNTNFNVEISLDDANNNINFYNLSLQEKMDRIRTAIDGNVSYLRTKFQDKYSFSDAPSQDGNFRINNTENIKINIRCNWHVSILNRLGEYRKIDLGNNSADLQNLLNTRKDEIKNFLKIDSIGNFTLKNGSDSTQIYARARVQDKITYNGSAITHTILTNGNDPTYQTLVIHDGNGRRLWEIESRSGFIITSQNHTTNQPRFL